MVLSRVITKDDKRERSGGRLVLLIRFEMIEENGEWRMESRMERETLYFIIFSSAYDTASYSFQFRSRQREAVVARSPTNAKKKENKNNDFLSRNHIFIKPLPYNDYKMTMYISCIDRVYYTIIYANFINQLRIIMNSSPDFYISMSI